MLPSGDACSIGGVPQNSHVDVTDSTAVGQTGRNADETVDIMIILKTRRQLVIARVSRAAFFPRGMFSETTMMGQIKLRLSAAQKTPMLAHDRKL